MCGKHIDQERATTIESIQYKNQSTTIIIQLMTYRARSSAKIKTIAHRIFCGLLDWVFLIDVNSGLSRNGVDNELMVETHPHPGEPPIADKQLFFSFLFSLFFFSVVLCWLPFCVAQCERTGWKEVAMKQTRGSSKPVETQSTNGMWPTTGKVERSYKEPMLPINRSSASSCTHRAGWTIRPLSYMHTCCSLLFSSAIWLFLSFSVLLLAFH